MDNVRDSIVLADTDGRLFYVNAGWEEMTGWSYEESVGKTPKELIASGVHDDRYLTRADETLAAGEVWQGRIVSRRRDGELFAQWATVVPVLDKSNKVTRYVGIRRDISDTEQKDEALEASEARYALATRGSNDGLWDWDFRSGELYLSARWYVQLGEADSPTNGPPDAWFDRVHAEDLSDLRLAIEAHRAGASDQLEAEYRIRTSVGEYRWMLVRGVAVRNEDGEAIRMAGSQTDITDRKEHEQRLMHNALHDALTGLPNRELFADRLRHSVRRLRRRPDATFAVLFVDLDRFKDVNDSIGHTAGDRLLQDVTGRIAEVIRPEDTLARLGGDEFTVLVEDIDQPGAMALAERIRESLSIPFELESLQLYVTASIGIAMCDVGASAEELLRNADRAMYHAKKRGRAQSVVYDVSTSGRLQRRLVLQQQLRAALPRGEVEAWFQPVVSLLDGRLLGFEALARWGHDPAVASPAEFIPLAEELGLIVPLGRSILEQACELLKRWEDSDVPPPELGVCVNLSPRQFVDPSLVRTISDTVANSGVNPAHLKVEITEGTAMTKHSDPVDVCQQIRDLGVTIAIDDFGTGYSSLSQLHALPVQTLKIDQSFVRRIDEDHEARAIVRTILSLGQSLGLQVVAEGVETSQQRRALLELGCLRGQGWLFGKAEPADVALRRIVNSEEQQFDLPSVI